MNEKTINMINRTLKQYGFEESINQTKQDVLVCINTFNKNSSLMTMFDKYDRGEITSSEFILDNEDHNIKLEQEKDEIDIK